VPRHKPKPPTKKLGHKESLLSCLQHARDRLVHGWCQHVPIDGNGNVCMSGAILIEEAAFADSIIIECIQLLADELHASGIVSVARYNDTPGRTIDEVLGVYDAVMKKLH
jgi:hypothetical protein